MTTTTSTSTVTALGAGSGVDIAALAKSLVEAERAPAKAVIDKKVTAATNSVSGYAAIKYVLDNLKTAFADLKDQSDFSSITPSNSQPTALSVTAGATALSGRHTVEVTSLATEQRRISAGFATTSTALNGGVAFTLSLSVHSAPAVAISVTDTTPAGVVSAINAAALGVTAQLMNTGDASAPYKIMVLGSTGAANDFTLKTDNGASGITRVTTQGATGVSESSALTFGTALSAGQSVTIGGLTYTSTGATSTTGLAAAFASLRNGAITGAGTATGTYSGKLTGFATGAASGSTVTATSATSSDVTFSQGIQAGQTVTIGGLTYTPTADATKEALAAAFASLADGAISGPSSALGTYSGTLSGFSTGPASGATVVADTPTTGNVTDIQSLGQAVSGLDFNTSRQPAGNAELKVDGEDISSSSNIVEGAISGATLNLNTVTSGTATLNLSRDTSGVKTKLQALVTAYNDAISMLSVVSDPKSTVATYGATLVGNSTVLQVRSQIRAMVMGDSSAPSGGMSALRDLGLSIDRTGNLQIDATKLDSALSTKFDNVVTLLSANRENLSSYSLLSGGVAGDAVKKLTALLDTTGVITSQSTNATAKISAYNKDLARLEDRMTTLLARYNKQLSAMDSIVGQTNSMRTGLTATFDGMMAAYTNK